GSRSRARRSCSAPPMPKDAPSAGTAASSADPPERRRSVEAGEVRGFDLVEAAADLLDRSRQRNVAALEHIHAIRDRERLADVLLDEQDADAAIAGGGAQRREQPRDDEIGRA